MTTLIPLFGIVSSMVVTVVLGYFWFRGKQRKAELAAELQTRLLDRFHSGEELTTFLQSPAGRSFIGGVQSASSIHARERVIGGVVRAIILIALAVPFFVMMYQIDSWFLIPAMILFCLGAGSLVAAFVAYQLSRRLGLIERSEG